MTRFFLLFFFSLLLDQSIKIIFLKQNINLQGEYISLILAFNKGVAFSMFEFLGESLKFIQIILLSIFMIYIFLEKKIISQYSIFIAFIFAGGFSNILDRFIHGAVIDYIFWHKWFEFAIFNLADVMINLGVFGIIIFELFSKKNNK